MTISDEAKERVAQVLQQGEVAVDATMGNGWDTLFLAEQVGPKGLVFGFDVQQEAVTATEKRLRRADLLECGTLLLRGHQEMAEIVPAGVGAVMFNLGYLPYAKREVVTRAETTLAALDAAAELLRVGGLLTVICYRGHAGGQEEARAVLDWAAAQKESFLLKGPEDFPDGEHPVLLSLQKC